MEKTMRKGDKDTASDPKNIEKKRKETDESKEEDEMINPEDIPVPPSDEDEDEEEPETVTT